MSGGTGVDRVRERVVPTGLRTLLGPDRPTDLALVAGAFVVFLVVDRLSRGLAVVGPEDLRRWSLVVAAAQHRWWLMILPALAGAGLALRWPHRLLIPWDGLEQGRALRLLSGTLIMLMTWQGACYRYNWLAGRAHGFDRILLAGLALAAIARPAFLLPFAIVSRIMAQQFVLPFDTAAGRNIDDLLVVMILAVAAIHLLHVVTGRNHTAPVVLLMTAALAAHFFIPGKGKVAIGWLGSGRIADLPLSSYSAGWLAHTDGAWARALAHLYDRFRWPIMGATLALELGSVVAVTRPRLVRWWLPGAVAFHLVTFATTGFWFVPWIVVEVGLFILLTAPETRSWAQANATPARGLVAAVAVLAAPVLFHPPGLAWLDAPVSYGYQIDATGTDGTRYQVPLTALAPLSHHVAFDRLQLGDTLPVAGAYGAVVSPAEIEGLDQVATFADLAEREAELGQPTLNELSGSFLSSFLLYAHQPHRSWPARAVRWLAPPEHFWTSRAEPSYRFQQPLDQLEIYLVRSIHHDGQPDQERELVATVTVGTNGGVDVEESPG